MNRKGQKNLKPFDKLTVEEQRKIASNGGKKSAEKRKEKKKLKEELEILLEMATEEGNTNQEAMCIAILTKAKTGDTKAFELIRDTILQKPKDEVINTIGFKQSLVEFTEE